MRATRMHFSESNSAAFNVPGGVVFSESHPAAFGTSPRAPEQKNTLFSESHPAANGTSPPDPDQKKTLFR